ncbi:MAG: hypothetical protein RIT04_189 [Candidatus Parcubacteria bacterium]|jgi:hypothetical protein
MSNILRDLQKSPPQGHIIGTLVTEIALESVVSPDYNPERYAEVTVIGMLNRSKIEALVARHCKQFQHELTLDDGPDITGTIKLSTSPRAKAQRFTVAPVDVTDSGHFKKFVLLVK